MKLVISHPWDIEEQEAIKIQEELAPKVIRADKFDTIRIVAGVDVAYSKEEDKLVAAIVLLDSLTFETIESSVAIDDIKFPYIPGLFSFRELPPIVKALEQLKNTPDLIVCDGQGVAHPRRFGLASHLGVLYDIPTIGCGKTRFIGDAVEPGKLRGDIAPLYDDNEMIGNVLRTQDHVKPIYVSIGHRISLSSACEWIIRLSPRYRLPETTRLADQLVRKQLMSV